MKTALCLLLAAALLIPLVTGSAGPARVNVICRGGTAGIVLLWTSSSGAVSKRAPVSANGTLARYMLDGQPVEILKLEFQKDGPDSIDVDIDTAEKVDVTW